MFDCLWWSLFNLFFIIYLLYIVYVYVLVHMYVPVWVRMHTCKCTYLWKPEGTSYVFLYYFPHCVCGEVRTPIMLDWLASELWESSCFHTTHSSLEFLTYTIMPSFYILLKIQIQVLLVARPALHWWAISAAWRSLVMTKVSDFIYDRKQLFL